MNTLLRVGDKFTSSKLNNMLYGEVARDPITGICLFDPLTHEPFVDFANLHTEDYECETYVPWTETKEDGWSRHRETKLSTKVKDPNLLSARWIVIKTDFTGGGAGHGQHDVYPNGHHVIAQRINGSEKVSFFQTGCFRGMLEPKDIIGE